MSELPLKRQVQILNAFGLSSRCIAYLLEVDHKQVRDALASLGIHTSKLVGGECEGKSGAELIRHLAPFGLPPNTIAYLSASRLSYVQRVLGVGAA